MLGLHLNIKELRIDRKLTQEELAEKSGVSRQTICALENKESVSAKVETLAKLASALDVNVSDFFK